MKNDRLRFTLDNPYAVALGRAVFAFARLEWDAVWCCNKLEPGYIDNLAGLETAARRGRLMKSLSRPVPLSWLGSLGALWGGS
jgi:hypothetical protein